ncbi:hypothetical protein VCUG_01474 [Vavraia culicis subsp. floridensis]|uniref:Uncharacterized protein n=1 Tax=Vavraia culicis (isolate floridensis) TaxID=948595 RepID=L2GTT6_VAVCU|nr:uncharacterized protein VCUG_01474 [Vavraia culicis subsp. floridensis]ELA47029.1 hypothetical protein VCUG_01474 [Vavraia culicis subsp. floridensis]
MFQAEKMAGVAHFDSDLSKNSTLIVSSPNGLLSIIKHNKIEHIKFDIEQKNVVIYPDGDELFTTSDEEQGLRVWDLESKKIVFSYPRDSLKHHIYMQHNNIAALTSLGIKFYDLRMRYSYNFYENKNITQLDYNNGLYFAVDYNVFAYQNNDRVPIYSSETRIKDLHDGVVLTTDHLYFIDEQVSKSHCADRIAPLHHEFKGQKILASTVENNLVNWIGYNHQFKERFKQLDRIDQAISNEDVFYIFGNKELYNVSFDM